MNTSPYAESILVSLRRIIRAIDLHSRELGARFQLTVPQLVCLRQIEAGGPCAPGDLARRVFLSQATVTGILNRLETRGLIQRERKDADRRRVTVSLTPKGQDMIKSAPMPLQQRFSQRLGVLSPKEQEHIDLVLAQVVEMMEAHELEAAPYMAPAGSLSTEDTKKDEIKSADMHRGRSD